MNLKLHNILRIEHADIEIGGLTVLTGENNSGKSTVGKILFSILKAVNNVRQIDKMKTISVIKDELSAIRRMFRGSDNVDILNDIQSLSVTLTSGSISVDDLYQFLTNKAEKKNFSSRGFAVIRNHLARIKQHIKKLDNPELAVREEFDVIAKSEFMESMNSYGKRFSEIYFHDDTTDADGSVVNLKISDGKVDKVSLWGNSSIEDVTYIESPLYLHLLNSLRLSSPIQTASLRGIPTSLKKENVPYHLADMAEKILTGADDVIGIYDGLFGQNYRNQLKEINSVIGGEFVLNNKTKQLSFNQKGYTVPTISVASGIKSFGVLQRLIETDNVSTFKMLIWDEPENHLHPEWQTLFCKLIIELVSDGVPVVISSHSPYFVQALRYYAAAKGIERDVRYYMAEESDDNSLLSTIKEVTNDLNQVFSRLAAPLREIMNVDYVRNSMK